MIDLTTGSGGTIATAGGTLRYVSPAVPGSNISSGNGSTYISSPYQAYLSMWAVGKPNNTNMIYRATLATSASTFPNGTTYEWDIIPDVNYLGIEGYLTVAYGNYDNNAVSITPRQTKNISTLSMNTAWVLTGNDTSGLLAECYLTTTSHTTGPISGSDPVIEIGFFPHCSASSKSFAAGLTSVGSGSFVDSNGITWNVGVGTSGIGAIPYAVATRVGYVDHQGPLDFKSFFTFLTASGLITGNEWFNGAAFGVEPYNRCISRLTISTMNVTYS